MWQPVPSMLGTERSIPLWQVLALLRKGPPSLLLDTPTVSEELSALVAHFEDESPLDTLMVKQGKGKTQDLWKCSLELFRHVHSPEDSYGAEAGNYDSGASMREWIYSAFFYFHRVHATSPSPAFLSSLCQILRDLRGAIAGGEIRGEDACGSMCQLINLYASVCTALERAITVKEPVPTKSKRRSRSMSAETDPSLSDLASQCHAALLEWCQSQWLHRLFCPCCTPRSPFTTLGLRIHCKERPWEALCA